MKHFEYTSTVQRLSSSSRLITFAALLWSALILSGCNNQAPKFENLDISGNTSFASDFLLPDTEGVPRSLADYKGKIVIVAFGYTHCPDVCPTTLAELSQTLDALGPKTARRVQVLFVTVDPQRDTGIVLSQYVRAFNPSFRALRPASASQLEQTTNAFRVAYEKVRGSTAENYTMSHTAACYVFDESGKLRLFVEDGQGVSNWLHDLKLLLA
jgi:protein SCO1/2